MTNINTSAEAGIIACILVDSSGSILLDAIAAGITDAYFEDGACAAIWDAINRVYDAGDPVDLLTVLMRMRSDGTLAKIGGPGRLNAIAGTTESTLHSKIWIRDLIEARSIRLLQHNADLLKAAIADGPESIISIADVIERIQEGSFRERPGR